MSEGKNLLAKYLEKISGEKSEREVVPADYVPPKKKRIDREIGELHLTPEQLRMLQKDRHASLRLIHNLYSRKKRASR